MSYQAVQWALDLAPMLRTAAGKPDTTARAVLVARAERADEDGRNSHAAIADVVWRTGYDERTVQRAEDRLEAAGLLVRDGVTRAGTTRWNLNMALLRDESERAEIEAAIESRKASEAARVREYRLKQKRQRTDAELVRTDSASVRTDPDCVRTDPDDVRTDAVPPEPPMNLPGTVQRTSQEPSLGTRCPQTPDGKLAHTSQFNEQPISIQSGQELPPSCDPVSYDRAHARGRGRRRHLSVIDGGAA